MKNQFLLLGLCFILGGCAGFSYAIENYKGIEPIAFQQQGESDALPSGKKWRIFNKPEENRLMITPTIGSSFGRGVAKGATFGIASVDPIVPTLENAAVEYLRTTGKECTPTKTFLIVKPQYEVQYHCNPPKGPVSNTDQS